MSFDYASVGGMVLTATGRHSKDKRAMPSRGTYWDFGWIGPDRRTKEQEAAHDAIMSKHCVPFKIDGKTDYPRGGKVALVRYWNHPEVVKALGSPFPGIFQQTGSCVGAGGGNSIFTTLCLEVLYGGQAEAIVIPFWLLPYGRSRMHAGMNGPGEGSLGSAFQQAMLEDGTFSAKDPGLPAFQDTNGLTWGARTEREWSDGRAIAREWLEKAKPHRYDAFVQCRNADNVRDAVVNGCAPTCASMWGMRDPGEARVQGDGDAAVLIGTRTGQWSHQMSVQGWWDHPSLGELFLIENQWSQCYPADPATGGRKSGVWVKKADMDWICNDEVFAPSGFNGIKAKDFHWMI